MCDALQIYRVGPQPGRSFYVPDLPNNREGPLRTPKCLNGWSYEERLAKEAFCLPTTRGSKKDSDRVITPAVEAVCVSAHLAQPGSPQAKQLCQLHVQLSLGRAATGNSLPSVHLGSLWQCLRRYRLWPARLLCQGEGFSGQEYWHVLANTGCHTFLECYISCCPTCQLP